ncbi:unnamed protein product [Kluyveromyces dobzhanskii CBS 2104]|uniref:WGS project CCBQ000000000 data, contig 00049 n=1 Tax=Kluyveromyces dobzhanskii CBS 2104 TaxID=1427455 RepID=A0A0A8L4P7_9SACH|nr:unnamed protein product [Kluyveromyces dobzhanskii CBS 2104]
MNAIYELDVKWKTLLTSENFLSGLTVNEFVTELSKDQALKQITSTGINTPGSQLKQLDAKPFIRTFESVLKELRRLQKETASKSGQLTQQVSQMELSHAKSIIHSHDQLKGIVQNYDQLDFKLSAVTQVVSPLGTKLEKSIKKKNAYIKSVELVSYYASFLENGECPELNKLTSSSDKREVGQGAVILKSLLILTKKLDTKSVSKTQEVTRVIEQQATAFEDRILEGFNEAYRESDYTRLHELAWILDIFNNGVNIIKNFTDKHQFFDESENFKPKESALFTNDLFKSELMNPDSHVLRYDQKVLDYIQSVFAVIKAESEIVANVFESKASNVMHLFIKKVFEEKLRPLVVFLLNSSLSLSSLAYIRSLHTYFSIINSSVKQLSEFLSSLKMDSDGKVSACLEKCWKNLFDDILFDRSKYFEIEKRTLESVLVQKASNFNMMFSGEIRPRNLANKLNEVTDFKSSPELKILTSRSGGRFSQLNLFLKNKFEKRFEHENPSNVSIPSMSPNTDHFTLSYIDLMIKCSVESLARVAELVPAIADEFTYELVEISLIGVIDSYIESALEVAYSQLNLVDIYREGNIKLDFLKFISTAAEMVSLVSAYIKSIVLPLLQNSPSIRRKVIALSNAYFKKCELLMNLLIVETSKILNHRFTLILAKQKKKDFLSKSQDFLDQDTETTTELVAVLGSVYNQSALYLKNRNLRSFLARIGHNLFDQLLNHYKKFQVSSTGGVIVTKDIIAIQTAVEEWNVGELNEKFATLRELSNLFTVQPELLTSLTKEGRLASLDRATIDEYISKREDYNQDGFINKFRASLRN